MRHFFVDRYSEIDSYIHRIDPRVKIVGIFALILSIIFTSPGSFFSFGLYSLLVAVLIVVSRIPLGFVFKRSLGVVPFVLMVAVFIPFFKKGEIAGAYSFGTLTLTVSYGGLLIFWNVLAKSYLATLSMVLLMASTRFSEFLKALETLRVPRLFIMIISFMYRYIFVLQDELMQMRQAKDSRCAGGNKWLHTKTLANMLGVLFIRAYERAENVYLAMCSRGFNGNISTIHNFQVKRRDIYFLLLIASVLAGIRIVGT